jgi:hypothetical protein
MRSVPRFCNGNGTRIISPAVADPSKQKRYISEHKGEMRQPNYNIILLLITITIKTNIGERCGNKNKQLLYKIKEPEPVKQIINIEETEIEITEYPESINLYTFKRRLYTKYCYNGGNIDPNTGCSKKTRTHGCKKI